MKATIKNADTTMRISKELRNELTLIKMDVDLLSYEDVVRLLLENYKNNKEGK